MPELFDGNLLNIYVAPTSVQKGQVDNAGII